MGFATVMISGIFWENPFGTSDFLYGYPFQWLEITSSGVSILWVGFSVGMVLYSVVGFAVSYLVFTLGENMRHPRFFIKSGAVFFVGSYIAYVFLSAGQATLYGSPHFIVGGELAFFISLGATPAATILYGYYKLFKKKKAGKVSQ